MTLATQNRRAFTLAEMVVVVGLIALLTVGIGRLFAGVSEAVGRGMATSELDAAARAIETRLRRDFELINRMDSEDLFLVIRAAELGGDPERPIYLTPDDAEADVRDRLEPYEEGSRAITTRLDEMAFLVRAPGAAAFRTQQDDGPFTSGQPLASAARIYYGHGLRPRLDPNWPPDDPDAEDAPTTPERQFVADGWFGSPPGPDDRDYLPDGVITGRNQYAGDWILARQPLLLYGARATGVSDPGAAQPAIGTDREYAPYIRDLENLSRFWDEFLSDDAPSGDADLLAWPGPIYTAAQEARGGETARPDPRLIGHGRVDISAQTLEGVKRWLEGEEPDWNATRGYAATPYEDVIGSAFGVPANLDIAIENVPRYNLQRDDLRSTTDLAVQRWLWKRAQDWDTTTTNPTAAAPGDLLDITGGGPLGDLAYNLIGVRSAIAGVLQRPLVEDAPPPAPRDFDVSIASGTEDADRLAAVEDAFMDTHAVLATRCSRFEIAWSDGSYWVEDRDLDGDGELDVREGDLVWFDPTRRRPDIDENDDDAERMTFQSMWETFGDADSNGALDENSPIRWAVLYTDPDSLRLDNVEAPLGGDAPAAFDLTLSPEVGFGDAEFFNTEATFDRASVTPVGRRLFVRTGGDFIEDVNAPTQPSPPYYNPDLTGGVPSGDGWPDANPAEPTEDMSEYLAIWPFRIPSSTGQWGEAYEKNVWIRVRYTLHDPQARVEGGRDYEVVLHMHPREERGG
jgi:type II secretory pathway pseudopilin PulG